MKNRNTLQRRLVLETVRRMRNHPTAEEIYLAIAAENPLISKATVYRNLKLLSEQGESLRIPIPDGADRFDFHVAPHYHIKCRVCSQVFDVDMPYQGNLCDQVTDAQGFQIESHQILFIGVCPDCQKKEKEQKGHRQPGQETHSKPRINTLNSEFKTSGETRTNEELDRSLSKHSFVKNEYLGSHHSSRTVCFDSETKGCGFG